MNLITLSQFSRWLVPPKFSDDEKTQRASIQNVMFLITIAGGVIFGLVTWALDPNPLLRLLLTGCWILGTGLALFLTRRGYVKQAGLVFSVWVWLIPTVDAWLSGTVLSVGFTVYPVMIFLIGLLSGVRMAFIFAGLSTLSGLGLLYVDANNLFSASLVSSRPVTIWGTLNASFISTVVALYMFSQEITKRKQIGDDLRASQERLKLAIHGTGGALWDEVLDPEASFDELSGIVYLSPEEKALLGYNKDEGDALPGLLSAWDSHVLPEDQPQREKNQRDHFEGRTDFLHHEYRIRRVDGSIGWIQSRSQIIKDEQNRPVRWVGIDWDVTERKQIEAELAKHRHHLEELVGKQTTRIRQANLNLQQQMLKHMETAVALQVSEENFRLLADNAQDGFIIVTGDENVVYVNQRCGELFGYTPAELCTRKIRDLVHPEVYEQLSKRYTRRISGENVVSQYESFFVHQNGQPYPVELTTARTVWHGKPGVMVSFRDISERKRAEELLRQERDFAQTLINTAQTIILVLNPQGKIEIFNSYLEQISGYSLKEVQGEDWFSTFLPKSVQDSTRELFIQAVDGTKTKGNVSPIVAKDGRVRQIEWHDNTLKDGRDQTIGLLAVGRDITKRLEIAEKARRAEVRYRNLFEQAPAMYVITRNEGGLPVVADCNNLFLSTLNYNCDQVIGRPLADFYAPESRDALLEGGYQRALTGSFAAEERRLVGADGQFVDTLLQAQPEVDTAGHVSGTRAMFVDITARKEAEEVIIQYAERLEILQQIEHGILSAHSVEEIGLAAMSRIRRLIPCQRATMTLFDYTTHEAVIVADSTDTVGQAATVKHPIKFTQGIHATSKIDKLKQGQIIIAGETILTRDFGDNLDKTIRSVMVVPLLFQNELVGSLNLSATETGVFTPQHQEIAYQVANQLAIAIHQTDLRAQTEQYAAEMEQRVADRTRELSALYEVTAVSSELLGLETMLERSLNQILVALESDAGLVFLRDDSEKVFTPVARQGILPPLIPQVKAFLLEHDILTQVLDRDGPVIIPNLGNYPDFPPELVRDNLDNYAGAPIRAAGQLIGILNIFGQSTQQFNIEELALLASVADQIGVTVENVRLREQAEELALIAERERLARELHDSVTQSLYSLTLFTEGSLELAKNGKMELVKHNLIRIGETAQQALKEMRMMLYKLRPPDLEQEGLIGALHQRLAAVEKRAGLNTRLVTEELFELPAAVEEELYWIIQEALNNIMKHAQASNISIYFMGAGENMMLKIVDDGCGFDLEMVKNQGGFGLASIYERVEHLNGSLGILSILNEGTTLHIEIPMVDLISIPKNSNDKEELL